MDIKTYYLRHQWHSERFIFAPAARRVMDYLIENTTTYPRYVDGYFRAPGSIITTYRRICDDLGISLRDAVAALNRLDLHNLISRHSNHDTIIITLPLDPDEITPPPSAETSSTTESTPTSVGAQSIAPVPPKPIHPKSESRPTSVVAQYIAPAPPAHSKKPERTKHSKRPLPLDRPIISPSKPRRGALMFSPMWKHGVSIQTNENEPRRGGIVIPPKIAPIPQPKHSKWSVALDRPTPTKNFCLSVELQRHPPIRGAPHSIP